MIDFAAFLSGGGFLVISLDVAIFCIAAAFVSAIILRLLHRSLFLDDLIRSLRAWAAAYCVFAFAYAVQILDWQNADVSPMHLVFVACTGILLLAGKRHADASAN